MANHWTCPFCNRVTTIREHDVNSNDFDLFSSSKYGLVGISWGSILCPNPECNEIYLRVSFDKRKKNPNGRWYNKGKSLESWTLRPESNSKPQPDYIPELIREDYYEACLIAEKSPKASATLSRRCLQGMIRDFWKITRRRLIDEVNALEEHVDADTWEAIKAVKDVGTIGAHMEQDIDLIIPVEPDEARLLISMIEQLFEDWYVQREMRKQRVKRVIDIAKDKKDKKNQNPAP